AGKGSADRHGAVAHEGSVPHANARRSVVPVLLPLRHANRTLHVGGLMPSLDELRAIVSRLRREVYASSSSAQQTAPAFAALIAAEADLAAEERKARAANGNDGLLFTTAHDSNVLGADTTGLEVVCKLRMAQVPTAIAHLLDPAVSPLMTCSVENTSKETRRGGGTSFVGGYSARAIDTFEIRSGKTHTFDQLPTFFPDRLEPLHELTRATMHIEVDDLDGNVELQRTQAIWLLPRTTAPLSVKDPVTGEW